MVNLQDIHPLTSFLRDHKSHLDRLRETGRPEVLTVNGKARVVVQDAEAYQRLVELLADAEIDHTIHARLKALEAGEPGVPADQVLARIRRTLGIDPS